MPGRCPLVHVKDFDHNQEQTDVGCGRLDLVAVLEAAAEVEVEWLILETEVYKVSPTESVRIGLENLKQAQNQ
jgi:sugar phosphate isomerase/epimerase